MGKLIKQLSSALMCIAISGCATQQSVHEKIKTMQTGPSATPHKSITNFASGLRCMDNMMIEYGVQDISMLVEDLSDKTGKVSAGTKDMLITAVSDMTRRSRAVKLIPFGNDSGNLIGFLNAAGSQTAYSVVPKYDIRGSISQLDSSVVREQLGGSLTAERWGLGASMSTAGSILGIDLSVLTTSDLSVLPGVTSSNAVALFKSGTGGDADATIKSTGIAFDFQVARSEATVQALRNLIELASIELIGRLLKLPYWQCLDIPEDNEDIQREIEDWYYAMQAHGELLPYVRDQLTARGFYPHDEADPDYAVRLAIGLYEDYMSMPITGEASFEVFNNILTNKAAPEPQIAEAPVPVESSGEPTDPVDAVPGDAQVSATSHVPSLILSTASGRQGFAPGESVSLVATSDHAGYVYCFYEDASNDIQRFFPNRFSADNFIDAQSQIVLPGNMPFDIVADEQGRSERITCFATAKNVFHKLPDMVRSLDFENLPNVSLEDIRAGFTQASSDSFAEATLPVNVN